MYMYVALYIRLIRNLKLIASGCRVNIVPNIQIRTALTYLVSLGPIVFTCEALNRLQFRSV